MALGSTQSNINRTQKDIADLQKKISSEKKKETDASSKAIQIQKSITKNTSPAMLKSKFGQISRCQNDITKSSKIQADLQKKLANKTSDLHRYQQQLAREQEAERKKIAELQKRRENDHLENQRVLTIEGDIQKHTYDVFISHASEDKDDFVRPLAEELISIGVKVWYDEFSLKWGDSLRQSIDKGLAYSKFGVVVISSAFIAKKWPQYEVNGLVAREIDGEKVILPIWHKVTKSEVLKYSPTLGDRLAMDSSIDEITDIAMELKKML